MSYRITDMGVADSAPEDEGALVLCELLLEQSKLLLKR